MMKIFNKPIVRLHLCGFIFTPKLIPSIALLIILPFLLQLGFWQLNRAHYKSELQENFAARKNHQPLLFSQLRLPLDSIEYYPVQVKGYYDNRHNIFLDNQIQDHRAGYHVLTPFLPENTASHQVVLIDRGWVSRLPNRSQLPVIAPVVGEQSIVGIIKTPPSKVFLLSQKVEVQWPLLIEGISLKKIKDALNQPVYPFLILLSPQAPHGFVRQWNPVVATPAAKHLGYAIQWFALGLTLVIIYLVVNIRRVPHECSKD